MKSKMSPTCEEQIGYYYKSKGKGQGQRVIGVKISKVL